MVKATLVSNEARLKGLMIFDTALNLPYCIVLCWRWGNASCVTKSYPHELEWQAFSKKVWSYLEAWFSTFSSLLFGSLDTESQARCPRDGATAAARWLMTVPRWLIEAFSGWDMLLLVSSCLLERRSLKLLMTEERSLGGHPLLQERGRSVASCPRVALLSWMSNGSPWQRRVHKIYYSCNSYWHQPVKVT